MCCCRQRATQNHSEQQNQLFVHHRLRQRGDRLLSSTKDESDLDLPNRAFSVGRTADIRLTQRREWGEETRSLLAEETLLSRERHCLSQNAHTRPVLFRTRLFQNSDVRGLDLTAAPESKMKIVAKSRVAILFGYSRVVRRTLCSKRRKFSGPNADSCKCPGRRRDREYVDRGHRAQLGGAGPLHVYRA